MHFDPLLCWPPFLHIRVQHYNLEHDPEWRIRLSTMDVSLSLLAVLVRGTLLLDQHL